MLNKKNNRKATGTNSLLRLAEVCESSQATDDERSLAASRGLEWIAELQKRCAESDSDSMAGTLRQYIGFYDTAEKLENALNYYALGIRSMVPEFENSVGCDFGCSYGTSTFLISQLRPRFVYGVDILGETTKIAEETRRNLGVESVSFASAVNAVAPIETDSVDWVIFNQVLCNDVDNQFDDSFDEAVRILKPGGILIVCDSNNPLCEATLERLHRVWHRNEIGDGGTSGEPQGHLFASRLELIRDEFPMIEEKDANRIALGTCYCWQPAIFESCREFLRAGIFPESYFDPGSLRPTIVPESGWANGNITNPFAIAKAMEKFSMKTRVCVMPSWSPIPEGVLQSQLRDSQGFYVYGCKDSQD